MVYKGLKKKVRENLIENLRVFTVLKVMTDTKKPHTSL